jgi:hypothetical protein
MFTNVLQQNIYTHTHAQMILIWYHSLFVAKKKKTHTHTHTNTDDVATVGAHRVDLARYDRCDGTGGRSSQPSL